MGHDVLARVHDDWFWRSWEFEHRHAVAREALRLCPDDPWVLVRALDTWHYVAAPSEDASPDDDEARALLRVALASAERSIARPDRPDTVVERLLTFWTQLHLALRAIVGDEAPSPAALAEADRLCDEVAALRGLPPVGDVVGRYDYAFYLRVGVRRRAWQAIAAGPPYPPWMREKLGVSCVYQDSCLGWPLRPLTRDPTFRRYVTAELAERTRAGAHPPPVIYNEAFLEPMLEVWTELDAPTPEETEGRLLLALWLGVDRAMITANVRRLLWDRSPPPIAHELLRRVLALGVVPEVRVLHEAIDARQVAAIRALVAAGVPIDRKAKLAATRSGHKGVQAALAGAAPVGDAGLADRLRAAARGLDPTELAWVASCFGRSTVDPLAIVEQALAGQPTSAAELLERGGNHPLADYVLARALRAAGLRVDVKKKRTWQGDRLIVSGDLIVDGAVIDALGGGGIIVAGDLVADALITEGEVVVGGSLRARTLVWGHYNDGSLIVNGDVHAPRLALTDHTFECRGAVSVGAQAFEEEAVEWFVPAVIVDGAIDRRRVVAAVKAGRPVLVEASTGPAARKTATKSSAAKTSTSKRGANATKAGKKSRGKKTGAQKSATKKTAAKKSVATKAGVKKTATKKAAKKTRTKTTTKKSTTKKSTTKKSTAAKSAAAKSTAMKSTVKKPTAAKSTAAKSTPAKSTPAKSIARR